MKRRNVIKGLIAAASAPAIIKSGILMPVKPIIQPRRWIDGMAHFDGSHVHVTTLFGDKMRFTPEEFNKAWEIFV